MDVADKVEATIVTVTQNGGIFVGIKRVELSSLGGLSSDTIYVKADARVSYQEILTVLEALEGHTRVLLTALPTNSKTTGVLPPYGVKVILNNH
jgi:biopolymer transport protein ExbD